MNKKKLEMLQKNYGIALKQSPASMSKKMSQDQPIDSVVGGDASQYNVTRKKICKAQVPTCLSPYENNQATIVLKIKNKTHNRVASNIETRDNKELLNCKSPEPME